MSKRSSLNSNRLIAAPGTERHLQAKNAAKHHQPYLRERQAFFTADAEACLSVREPNTRSHGGRCRLSLWRKPEAAHRSS